MGSGCPPPSPQSTTAPQGQRIFDKNPRPCNWCKQKKLGCKYLSENGICGTCTASRLECTCCDRCKQKKVVCVVEWTPKAVHLSPESFKQNTVGQNPSTATSAPFFQTIEETLASQDRRPVKRKSTDATLVNEEVSDPTSKRERVLAEAKCDLETKFICQGTFQTYPTQPEPYSHPSPGSVSSSLIQQAAPIQNTMAGGWTPGDGAAGLLILSPRFIIWSISESVKGVQEHIYEIDEAILKFEKAGDICTITLIAMLEANHVKYPAVISYENLPEIAIPQTAWQWIMGHPHRAYCWDSSNLSRNHFIECPSSLAGQGHTFIETDDAAKGYHNPESVAGVQWTEGPIFDSPRSNCTTTLHDELEPIAGVDASDQTPQYPNRAFDEIQPRWLLETAVDFSEPPSQGVDEIQPQPSFETMQGQSHQIMRPAAQESLFCFTSKIFPPAGLSLFRNTKQPENQNTRISLPSSSSGLQAALSHPNSNK